MSKRFTVLLSFLLFFLSSVNFAQVPVITKEPLNQGVIEGQTATFLVEAQGVSLTYKWFKNDTLIVGAVNATYTTPTTILSNNKSKFKCVVTNLSGSDTSTNATLYVTAIGSRVTEGIQLLYNFDEAGGTTVIDNSGVGSPYNLNLYNASAITWTPNGMSVNDLAYITGTAPLTKVIDACKLTNEVTIEVWVQPTSLNLAGWARIVTLSDDSYTHNNFALIQSPYGDYDFRVRTNTSGAFGQPALETAPGLATKQLTHIVCTKSSNGERKIYVNGTQVASDIFSGDFSEWNTTSRLQLANQTSDPRAWLGTYYMVSIYERALNQPEVVANYNTGVAADHKPVIVSEPLNQGLFVGQTEDFTVRMAGDPSSFQWKKNGVDIPGAINSYYTLPSVSLLDNGNIYSCVATNSFGSDTSRNAKLYVTAFDKRVTGGQLALYNFQEGVGDTIKDVSGYDTPVNLKINSPASVQWKPYGLKVNSSADISSIDVASKINNEIITSGEFTFEAWVRPENITQLDAAILTMRPNNTADRTNFTMNQEGNYLKSWLRTSNTSDTGDLLRSPDNSLADSLLHIVYSHNTKEVSKIYINGSEITSDYRTGDLSNWRPDYNLRIANQFLLNKPWKGLYNLVSFYGRALNSSEITHNYSMGPAGNILIKAPNNLTAQANQPGRVALAWQDSSNNEDGFIIERKYGAFNFTVLDSVILNVTSYTDTSVADTTNYTYRVKAFNLIGQSGYSNTAAVTTLLPTIVAPSNLTVSLSPTIINRAQLTWQDNSTNETGFIVERKTGDSTSVAPFAVIGTRAANVTSFVDSTLADTTTYTFRVKAIKSSIQSGYTNLASVTTLLSTLAAPNNLIVSLSPTIVNRAQLTWQDNSSNEFGFIIERKTGDSASVAPFLFIGARPANVTSFIDSTLADTTTYTFRVKAFNSFTQSGYTNLASVTTVLSTIAAPTNLAATLSPTIVNRAQLTWQDKSLNESGFTIERKTGDSASVAPFTVIGTRPANSTSFVDSTLADTTTYTFRVKAFNSFTQSGYTNLASVTTVLSTLAAPANLNASLSLTIVNRAQLTWQDKSSNELGFVVERKTGDSASVSPFTVRATLGANVTSFVDSTLADTTTYTFRVKAFNSFIQSGYTNLASVTTVLSTLAAPANLTASLSPTIVNRAQLTWQDKSSNETGFTIERKAGDSASVVPFTVIGTRPANSTSFVDSTLADTTTYTFRVKAFNTFIQSGYTNLASVTTVLSTLAAPSNLTVNLSPTIINRAQLTWQDKSSNELGFTVERKKGDSASVAPFTVIGTLAVNATSFVDSTLADTTTYTFRVKAFNSFIQSGYTNLASITTTFSSIAAPTNLLAFKSPADSHNVKLTWVDKSANELGFIIERKTGDSLSTNTFSPIGLTSTNITVYEDSTVADSTTYTYRVKAFNLVLGSSNYSNLAQITTPVPVEFVSFIASAANGRVQLDWVTATELNNAGFSIQRSKDNSKFIDLAFIKGKGTTTTQSAYSYSDKSTLSGKYYYRLKQVDLDGSVIYTKSIEVDLGLPKDFALEQNYPNPFNPSTTIRFSLPINGQVNVKLFNALGQEVVNIFNGELNAGIHETNFNASNLASGVYFYMLKVQGVNGANFTSTKRMILMK